MCGILACYSIQPMKFETELIIRMRDTMFHRGPDDAGIFIDDHIALAHRRLSIIDLTPSGHQPMFDENRELAITYNGEIYNYLELRKELETRGHRFKSVSDTEVIIHQYEEDGERCVEKFNGMFGFAIWDKRKKQLFAARDRIGIKPVYYYFDGKKLLIASEIKAIIEDRSISRKPDHKAVADYFFAGRPLAGRTMFEGIKELDPGSWLMIGNGKKEPVIKKYWDLDYQYNYARTMDDVVDELTELVDNAVMIHCRSDAPVGGHLSGGLDSSTVVAYASKYVNPLKTFSIKFSDDPSIDETRYAKAVANRSGCHYLEKSPTADDLFRLYPLLTWHLEQPMNNSGFSYYSASQFAKEHVKVSLTGHGGDELFAGYPAHFKAAYHIDNFARPQAPGQQISLAKRVRNSLSLDPVKILRTVRNKIFKQQHTFEQIWINLHCNSLYRNVSLYTREFSKYVDGHSSVELYLDPFKRTTNAAAIDKCLYHDLMVYLPSLLHVEDRVSMAVSLESRVPLLDYRIAEFLATVPPEQKIFELQPKFLLRKSAESILPPEVVSRKEKFPFPVPEKFWSSIEIKNLLYESLTDPDSFVREILTPSAIEGATRSNAMSPYLLGLEMWHRIFIRNEFDSQRLS